jgi:diguanylate cyclase (GGDEF)-like protein/PAS domain S-box-containing protein
VVDQNYRILEWNQSAESIFGWSALEALNKDIIDFLVPSFDKTHVMNILQKASTEGSSHSKNYNITKYRNEIFCEWGNRLLPGGKGEILCMAQDITATKKTLDELSKRSTALESAGDAIFYTDHKGLIEFANRSFFLLNLGEPNEVYGKHIGTYLFNEKRAFSAIQSQFNADHMWRGTLTKPSPKGDKVLSVTITAIYNRQRLISYVANLHDITQLSTHVDTLTHKAHHDPLTGATNRAAMDNRLFLAIERASQTSQRIALFFIDLNDFKIVNDRYGHEVGDKLLSEVAKNLKACLRNTDTVSRYGGDEFVVIIEDIHDQEHIETVFHTIQSAINEPIIINEHITLQAKASVGMAIYPEDALDTDALIKAADSSMYRIKKEKNSVKALSPSESVPTLYADNHSH